MRQIAALGCAFAAISFGDTFTNVDYLFKAEGTDTIQLVSGTLSVDSTARKLSFSSTSRSLDVPTASVTSISYERASQPRHARAAKSMWAEFGPDIKRRLHLHK